MIDVEPLLEESFARLHPLPAAELAWDDVLARTGVRRRRPRRALLAAAFAAVTAGIVVAAALAGSLWSFPDWLGGHPGTPASAQEQDAFAQENARSWAGFPPGTELRRLIETDEDGVRYTLYGFRSGDQLCLRLDVAGAATGTATGCAPLSDLRSRPAPALPIHVDDSFGTVPGKQVRIGPDTFTVARAGASFGIVADGVRSVTLRSQDAARSALLASDAFLSVVSEPKTGVRVQEIEATTDDGRQWNVPFAQAPFATGDNVTAPTGTLHGPAQVDRVVHGGSIGWLDRREPRGEPLPAGFPAMLGGQQGATLVFGRLLRPDPQSSLRVAVTVFGVSNPPAYTLMKPGIEICSSLVSGHAVGGGCSSESELFPRRPFSMTESIALGSDQYEVLSGLASDDVASLRVFLGDGGVVPVPLRDNAFVVEVARARLPVRVVAYDAQGRAIGIGTPPTPGDQPAWSKPDPQSQSTLLESVTDADGRPATLWTRRSLTGGTCFAFRGSGGVSADGCLPPQWQGPAVQVGFLGDPRESTVLQGSVRQDVVRLVVRYESGATQTVTPERQLVLAAVRKGDRIAGVDGYDSAGKLAASWQPTYP